MPTPRNPRSLRRARLITIAAAVVFVASLAVLIARIDAYQENQDYTKPVFNQVLEREFIFGGQRFSIETIDPSAPEGPQDQPAQQQDNTDGAVEANQTAESRVRLTYAEQTVTFPIGVDYNADETILDVLPFFVRHEDWLRILRIATPRQDVPFEDFQQQVQAGQWPERLVIVTRTANLADREEGKLLGVTLPEGEWGYQQIQTDAWVFNFYELIPDNGGVIEATTYRFPMSARAFQRLQQRAAVNNEPEPQRPANELKERTWQWYAAQFVIPRGRLRPTFEDSALAAVGWPLPVAAFSGVLFCVAILFCFPPSRKARWTPEESAANNPDPDATSTSA